ncbi:helix-turn-helix domain-containing protein [Spirillospora sp. NPDC127200]
MAGSAVGLRALPVVPELRPPAGEAGLDRPVRRVFSTDLPDPGRYLAGGELALTGLMRRRGGADSEAFVEAVAGRGALPWEREETVADLEALTVLAAARARERTGEGEALVRARVTAGTSSGVVARSGARDALLGALEDYDARHNSEPVPTPAVFLARSGSWRRCADELRLHVNTVRCRIRRVEELTGRDLSDLSECVDFHLALRIAGWDGAARASRDLLSWGNVAVRPDRTCGRGRRNARAAPSGGQAGSVKAGGRFSK